MLLVVVNFVFFCQTGRLLDEGASHSQLSGTL